MREKFFKHWRFHTRKSRTHNSTHSHKQTQAHTRTKKHEHADTPTQTHTHIHTDTHKHKHNITHTLHTRTYTHHITCKSSKTSYWSSNGEKIGCYWVFNTGRLTIFFRGSDKFYDLCPPFSPKRLNITKILSVISLPNHHFLVDQVCEQNINISLKVSGWRCYCWYN